MTAMLSYGKRLPVYETDGLRVTLRLFDGGYDERTATLVAQWKKAGREVDLDGLLVLAFLRENAFLDSVSAAKLLQVERDQARSILDHLAQPQVGILERRGRTKAVTYHLTKAVARDLLGKAAYTKTRGLDPIRYAEMVKAFVADHGSISPRECRELLGLGESQSARVQVSQMLARWSTEDGFLRREGQPPKVKYYPRT
jgi:ATP-dependent DNA helicase RecG